MAEPTPRTDAQATLVIEGIRLVAAEFARQLERELAEAKRDRDTLAEDCRQRDERIARLVTSAGGAKPRRELAEALRAYEQADMDGVFVKVSRQACDEAAEIIERLTTSSVEDIKCPCGMVPRASCGHGPHRSPDCPFTASASKPTEEPQHVCGLQGYGQEGDRCPACEKHRMSRERRGSE